MLNKSNMYAWKMIDVMMVFSFSTLDNVRNVTLSVGVREREREEIRRERGEREAEFHFPISMNANSTALFVLQSSP